MWSEILVYILTFTVTIEVLVTLLWNILVICLYFHSKINSLYTTHIYHMALVDMLTGLTVMLPHFLSLSMKGPEKWAFSMESCKFTAWVFYTLTVTSFILATQISLDRLILVTRCRGKPVSITKWKEYAGLLVSAGVIAVFSVLLYSNVLRLDPLGSQAGGRCRVLLTTDHVFVKILVLAPAVFYILLNVHLYGTLHCLHRKRLTMISRPSTVTYNVTDPGSSEQTESLDNVRYLSVKDQSQERTQGRSPLAVEEMRVPSHSTNQTSKTSAAVNQNMNASENNTWSVTVQKERSKRHIKQMLKTLKKTTMNFSVVTSLVFFLTWMPFALIIVIYDTNEQAPDVAVVICFWLFLAKPGINPFIYARHDPIFRRSYRNLPCNDPDKMPSTTNRFFSRMETIVHSERSGVHK